VRGEKGEIMDAIRFLPTKVHTVLDFIVGIVLILLPSIFGFSDVGGGAVWLPIIIGIASIIMGLFTQGYGFAVARIIPLKIHLMVDLLAGLLLALSPWIWSFSDEATHVWLWQLVIGIALVIVSQVTKTNVTAMGKETTAKATA
jgi:hypothetical protein